MGVFKRLSFRHNNYHATQPDYAFIGLTLIMLALGLLFLSSASSVVGFQNHQDSYYYLKRQLIFGVVPGMALFWFFSIFPYQKIKKFAFPALVFCFLILIMVYLPVIGFSSGGARRWLNLGFTTIQPSEFVKLGLIIYLAAWLESKGELVRDLKKGLVPFVLTASLIMLLIILQPDLGTATVIAVSSAVAFFVAGARLSHLFSLAGVGAGLLWLLIKIAPYRAARLNVFLHPELDPQGIGYHINQALLAVGSGGWFGLGLGYSRQKHLYLPEVTGDSIFAIIAEEIGFIFTTLFLLVIASWFVRAFRIARFAPDMFGKILAAGIIGWLGWQMGINIASMVGILPLTGVPLPFVSAGGTALATALAASGILVNISRQVKTN